MTGQTILETVAADVAEHDMLAAGDRVLVGVSGGPDSVALLNILNELAHRFSITLAVAHLDHGLRPEAAQEARFVKTLAVQRDLPFHFAKQDVAAYRREQGLSIEEAAREVRYTFYKRVMRTAGCQKLALGHHSEDSAELVLMNILRGSGPLGLSGIPPVRDGWIVRPLINLTRDRLLNYLNRRQLEYVNDLSNLDMRFTRNRIRHQLLPMLKNNFNANIVATLHRTARITGDENQWLSSLTDPLCESVITARSPRQLSLDIAALGEFDIAPFRRILRRAITLLRGSLRRVTFGHIEALHQLVTSGPENARVDLPGLIAAVKQGDQLVLAVMDRPRKPLAPHPPAAAYHYLIEADSIPVAGLFNQALPTSGASLIFSCKELPAAIEVGGSGQHSAFFDIDRLKFPLIVRNYQPGDRFTPFGMQGSKKVKKLFNERRVPQPERGRCPVLVSDDRILWVVGYQRARDCSVTDRTRQVLEVKFVLPDEK